MKKNIVAIFIKDIGWKTVGYDDVEEILQSNDGFTEGFTTIKFKNNKDWNINPRYIVTKVK